MKSDRAVEVERSTASISGHSRSRAQIQLYLVFFFEREISQNFDRATLTFSAGVTHSRLMFNWEDRGT